MTLFADAIGSGFRSVHRLVPRALSTDAEEVSAVDRVLYYPYEGVVETRVSSTAWLPASLRLSLSELMRRSILYSRILTNEWTGFDITRHLAARDWQHVIRRYKISSDDIVFFPSTDYYGAVSLLDALGTLNPSSIPHIHFRMIGVMETSAYRRHVDLKDFLAVVDAFAAQTGRISMSAETPRYQKHLTHRTKVPVAYLPYPPGKTEVPVAWGAVKVIASPGQGRADKGFFRLQGIARQLFSLVGRRGWKIRVQDMRATDRERRQRYSRSLSQSPNVEVLPARLPQTAIDGIYAESDILILPYDQATYFLRGSAVYQEGIATGRPFVCSSGTGIADLVILYKNGFVARDDVDMANKIQQLIEMDRTSVAVMTTSARERYQKDFADAVSVIRQAWMDAL